MYLLRGNTYRLSENYPDDTFKKRWNSKRAKISPVVQRVRKQTGRVKVCEQCLFTLEKEACTF